MLYSMQIRVPRSIPREGERVSTNDPQQPAKRLYSTEEVAQMLHMTPKGFADMRLNGRGPKGIRIGKRILYRPIDCDRWLEEQAKAQGVRS